MKSIFPGLHIGPQSDYATVKDDPTWSVVRTGNEFFPDNANTAESTAPVREGKCLFVYLRDAVVELDIPVAPYETALKFIHEQLSTGQKVLIHCSQGVSRSASIGMLYLASRTDRFQRMSFEDAVDEYDRIFPPLHMGVAIRTFVKRNWDHFNRTA